MIIRLEDSSGKMFFKEIAQIAEADVSFDKEIRDFEIRDSEKRLVATMIISNLRLVYRRTGTFQIPLETARFREVTVFWKLTQEGHPTFITHPREIRGVEPIVPVYRRQERHNTEE